jgi:hypothetical protein
MAVRQINGVVFMACHSAVIWRGPSPMDGAPICAVAIISQSSRENTKTGAVAQTYILREDIDPRDASKSRADYSICGDCPMAGIATADPKRKIAKDRICYVQLGQGPLNVFKAMRRGVYPVVRGHAAIAAIGRGRVVRLGTYGDPAMVPVDIWASLISEARGHMAYSHQANVPAANFRADLYMRSIDSVEEAYEAWASGQRTFRVINSVANIVKGKEILCPASKEAGRRVQCADCQLCGGTRVQAKSIAIPAH